jgi:ribonuclease BN (tRNA processing enzyme)
MLLELQLEHIRFSTGVIGQVIHILLKHLNMDHMLTHPENFKSRHIYSIKTKLQNNYDTFWKINQGVMMSVFAQPDPVFDHGNNSVNI